VSLRRLPQRIFSPDDALAAVSSSFFLGFSSSPMANGRNPSGDNNTQAQTPIFSLRVNRLDMNKAPSSTLLLNLTTTLLEFLEGSLRDLLGFFFGIWLEFRHDLRIDTAELQIKFLVLNRLIAWHIGLDPFFPVLLEPLAVLLGKCLFPCERLLAASAD